MYDEKIVVLIKQAFMNTYYDLMHEHNENFYYLALILDAGMRPYFSAWSYEAFIKSVSEQGISDNDRSWWKWDYSDSPYVTYGFDKYFYKLSNYLDQKIQFMDDDELYDTEWDVVLESMVEALKEIREENDGVKEFSNLIINVEVAPPDGEAAKRALIINRPSELLDEYLKVCDESDESESKSKYFEAWHPQYCKVILIKPIEEKSLAVKIRKDFSSNLKITDFIAQCNRVPFVIRDDILLKDTENIIAANKKYKEYIKIEK